MSKFIAGLDRLAATRINPVVQEDATGCGIAAVAMLAGVRYHQAKRAASLLGIQVSDSRLWSGTAFVRRLLEHYSIIAEPQEQPFCSWHSLPPLALLAIKWRDNGFRVFWHWVVFRREGEYSVVLDPKKLLRNNIRTDFGRIRPRWFITIHTAPSLGHVFSTR